jgi:NADPH-dependent 2,4-dienoyl-CoA reductase/sulfur reductase-like enzyme
VARHPFGIHPALGDTADARPASAVRRRLLGLLGLLATLPVARAQPAGRVLVIGGGWGGLAAAAALRRLAPELSVTLVERQARFFSLPLSNRWLAGHLDPALLWRDYVAAAARHGYRWLHAEVDAIDRQKRQVTAGGARLDYDWLILACGIRHDYRAWFGDDAASAKLARDRFGGAYQSGEEVASLGRRLDAFAGGTLLMNVPAGPARCPPAPYERAIAIAHRLRRQGVPAHIILLDPGAGGPGFRELIARQYAAAITHVAHAPIRTVDPVARRVTTEFDDYRFDEALLLPPQQAGDLVWQAGLIGRDGEGRPTGWAAQDPLHLQATDDERVFVVGDAAGPVSPLFGHYAKTAQIAVALGAIAAAEIAARSRGGLPEAALPAGVCHVASGFEPPAALRIHVNYRRRGDGLIVQGTRQEQDPQPRDEDLAWLAGLLEPLF